MIIYLLGVCAFCAGASEVKESEVFFHAFWFFLSEIHLNAIFSVDTSILHVCQKEILIYTWWDSQKYFILFVILVNQIYINALVWIWIQTLYSFLLLCFSLLFFAKLEFSRQKSLKFSSVLSLFYKYQTIFNFYFLSLILLKILCFK